MPEANAAIRRGFEIRTVGADDADAGQAFYEFAEVALPGLLAVLLQTGNAFLAAYDGSGRVRGMVRYWDEDGTGWLDLLVSAAPGAGRALMRGVERRAQDHGIRFVRLAAPDASGLPAVVQRWGYRPVGHREDEVDGAAVRMLVHEKRLALLTVREQRRADAAAIGELTGEDPWVFEQGTRPGVFVAADGDNVVGFASVRDGGSGLAQISEPKLNDAYRGRGMELWMIERAATYAETNGFHSAQVAATALLDTLGRDLEDRFWHRTEGEGGPIYVRRFRDLDATREDENEG
ncbi:MAG: hypothetical protein ABIP13_03470 [Tepidiformaceae bacterium]